MSGVLRRVSAFEVPLAPEELFQMGVEINLPYLGVVPSTLNLLYETSRTIQWVSNGDP